MVGLGGRTAVGGLGRAVVDVVCFRGGSSLLRFVVGCIPLLEVKYNEGEFGRI